MDNEREGWRSTELVDSDEVKEVVVKTEELLLSAEREMERRA